MGVLVGLAAAAVVGVIAACVVGWLGRTLLARHRTVDTSWIAVSLALRRRHDLIERISCIERRGSSMRPLFDAVHAAQTEALDADRPAERARAEARLQATLRIALDAAGKHPAFRRSRRLQQFRAEVTDVDNRIAYSRTYFNDAVRDYNKLVNAVPTRFVAVALGYVEREPFESSESPVGV